MHRHLYLLLLLLRLLAAAADDQQSFSFTQLEGAIRVEVSEVSITADSLLGCLIRTCAGLDRCVVSFNVNTGACRVVNSRVQLLSWSRTEVLDINADDKNAWHTFAPIAITQADALPHPLGLWLLDSTTRGSNLGSRGHALNFTETGIKWNAEGPRRLSTGLTYARLDGYHRGFITNRINGSFALHFTKAFTVGFWVRTDNRAAFLPIINGQTNSVDVAYIWFRPSYYFDQITFYGKETVVSSRESRDKLFWRHMAVVYDGINYSLYLNATAWEVSSKAANSRQNVDPETILLGYRPGYVLIGAMACLSFFDEALTLEQVRTLMQICP